MQLLEPRDLLTNLVVTSLGHDFVTDGQLTLAEALWAAETDTFADGGARGNGPDTITFDPALVANGPATINLNGYQLPPNLFSIYAHSSDFEIFTDVQIVGPSGNHGITLNNVGQQRLFEVRPGGSLTLENLTLSGGNLRGANGIGGGGGAGAMGGAIFNEGSLTVLSCLLTGNSAVGGAGSMADRNLSGIGGGPEARVGGISGTAGAAAGINGTDGIDGTPGADGQDASVRVDASQGHFRFQIPDEIVFAARGKPGGDGTDGTDALTDGANGLFGGGGGRGGAGGLGGKGGPAGRAGTVTILDLNGQPTGESQSFASFDGFPGAGGNGRNGGNGGFGGGGGAPGPGAVEGHPGLAGFGGGDGGSQITAPTFIGPVVISPGEGGGGAGMGGAIFNNGGNVTVVNSTFYDNNAQGGRSIFPRGFGPYDWLTSIEGHGHGGAIFSRNGSLTIQNSTIFGNNPTFPDANRKDGPRGIFVLGDGAVANVAIDNSIVDQGFPTIFDGERPNFANIVLGSINAGSVVSSGVGNLIRYIPDNGAKPAYLGNIGVSFNADPLLEQLDDNGGPTKTLAPKSNSPAINAGENSLLPSGITLDQRGFSRIAGGTIDIGAFELSGAALRIAEPPADVAVEPGDTAIFSAFTADMFPELAPSSLTGQARLLPGEFLLSPNHGFKLTYQTDGNLVVYRSDNTPLWASQTAGTSGGQAVMQSDGNFVIYDASMNPQYASGTHGNNNAVLRLQDDGSLVIQSADGNLLATIYANPQSNAFTIPSVQWQMSTDNGATFANVPGATLPVLTIPNVTSAELNRQYRVRFTRFSKSLTSSAGRLYLLDGPRSFVVTTDSDTIDPFDSLVSFREAVLNANADARFNTITFGDGSASGGTNFLDEVPDTILLSQGELNIRSSMTIVGEGPTKTIIEGNVTSRIFHVTRGSSTISGVTLQHGGASSFDEEALDSGGGAILNLASLTLLNSTVAKNGSLTNGGGVLNRGTFVSINNTYTQNICLGSGTIANYGTFTSTNDTIARNTAVGAVMNAGTWNSRNTIVAGNITGFHKSSDVVNTGTVNADHTLIGDISLSGPGMSSGVGYEAIFGVPFDFVTFMDPSRTFPLPLGSVAINAGNNAVIPAGVTTDQSGAPRIAGGTVDVGAFEAQLAFPQIALDPADQTVRGGSSATFVSLSADLFAGNASNSLSSGAALLPGDYLLSPNRGYQLIYQTDGDLVLYRGDHVAIWSSGTAGYAPGRAEMQSDGNFVIYDDANVPRFHTATFANSHSRLVLQDDGNLVVYSIFNTSLFETGSRTNEEDDVPTIQWQVSSDHGATFTDILGATDATLTIPNVAMADHGKQYRAMFTKAAGSVASNAATLTVLPNAAPTAVVLTPSSGTLAENTNTVSRLHLSDITISDDGVGSNVLRLSGADAGFFEIVGTSLYLKAGGVLDYETRGAYDVTVEVDDATVGLNVDASAAFHLTVEDVNEMPSFTSGSSVSVAENTTAVTTVTATDPDAGATLSFSISDGIGAQLFSLNSSTGVLTFKAAPNFEAPGDSAHINDYNMVIFVTDGTYTLPQPFTVRVLNVNEAPTALALTSTSIAENNTAGAVIGTFTTADPDAGDTFNYALISGVGDTNNGAFSIIGDQLRVSSSFDFEAQSSYSIRVRTTDAGGLTFDRPFTINVTNVNEGQTALALSNATIAENNLVGAAVGTFSTTDVDAGETFTYTLVSGAGDTNNGAFSIVGNQLRASSVFNFEAQSSYSIRVRTADAGGLTLDRPFTINVTNVNEGPTALALSNATIAENNLVGAAIGTFSTSDVDAGDTFTYTLVSGAGDTNNGAFSIVGNQLRASSVFNFEAQSSYSIRVRTADAGGLTLDRPFTINVTNVNEGPTFVANSITITEGQTRVVSSSDLGSIDPDHGPSSLVYNVAGISRARFELLGSEGVAATSFTQAQVNAGQVRLVHDGGEFAPSYTLSVSDGMLSAGPAAAAIVFTNVNDAPQVKAPLPALTVYQQAPSQTISLIPVFSDVDNVTLTYTAISSNTSLVTATVDNGNLTLGFSDSQAGSATVSVMATDAGNMSVKTSFQVTVNQLVSGVSLANGVLSIIGSLTNDFIRVERAQSNILVFPNVALPTMTVFSAANVQRIHVLLREGNDIAIVGASVTVPVTIEGGKGNDYIESGSGSDTIVGGEGSDRIRAGAGDDFVDGGPDNDVIDAGLGNDLLLGSGGNDQLLGAAGNDLLLGGHGNDTLQGGDGNDVLVGGFDADNLNGGSDDDLLIANRLMFEDNLAVLAEVIAEWSSNRSYSSRVSNLKGSGAGPRNNGSTFIQNLTLIDDPSVDLLFGTAGQDWFVGTGGRDEFRDRVDNEILN